MNGKGRYRSQPNGFKQIKLNAKDLEILKTIWDFRFLTIEQIFYLFRQDSKSGKQTVKRKTPDGKTLSYSMAKHQGFGQKAIYKRLLNLFQGGYVRRHFFSDMPIGRGYGSSPAIYSLNNHGAKAIAEPGEEAEMKRIISDEAYRHKSLRHDILRSKFGVMLTLACRESSVKLGVWQVRGLRSEIEIEGEIRHFTPDALFSLEQGDKRYWFFLEVDQSTCNIASSIPTNTSIFKKVGYYWNFREQGKAIERFDIHGFRVIFLTKQTAVDEHLQESRQKHIIEALRSSDIVPNQTNLFKFINERELDYNNPQKILTPIFSQLRTDKNKYTIFE